MLFKALNKRSKVSEMIMKRQQALAHLLVVRIVNVVKGYLLLLSEGRAVGSDLEAETRFLLKRMSQLETGPGVFEGEREWLKKHLSCVPR